MFDELRHFVLAHESGTFTAAARRANLSQPAFSASIQRLEECIGAVLLHRGRRGATLTAAGSELLPRARAALAAVEEGKRAVEEIAGLRAGEVRIGAGATACSHLLPPYMAQFRRAHPKIRFRVRELGPSDIELALENGELDLGIAMSKRGDKWREDPLVLVAAPKTELKDAQFITASRNCSTRRLLEQEFPEVEIGIELNSIAAMLNHARAGLGVALVSRAAAATDLKAGLLIELPDRRTPVARTLRLRHQGLKRLSPAASAFRELLLRGR